jgi:ATP-binding protein involved in chromosome partitioning
MSADPRAYLEPAATQVRDPVSGRSVWLAGIVQDARFEDGKLRFDLVFGPEHSKDQRKAVESELLGALREAGWEGDVQPFLRLRGSKNDSPAEGRPTVPGMNAKAPVPHGGPIQKKPLVGVKHIVAVASGKGGVGKSTVATNLALALKRLGLSVGLLDADVYGPSLPRMMRTSQRPMVAEERIVPVLAYGVRCLSVGLVVPEEEAMIWRGPMVMDIVRRFLQEARWGELDVLVVDLPPGTGDVQLTLLEAVDLSGAVIVTTPQEVALADAVRGITMFKKLGVPLLGVVENMAWYELPDGTRDPVFGEGGGARIAAKNGVELLAQLPLRTALRHAMDAGLPPAMNGDAAFLDLAQKVAGKLGLGVA